MTTSKYKVFKYNEGDFHTKYHYLFNCNCSNDVARFIMNSSDTIIIKKLRDTDIWGYPTGEIRTDITYMYKTKHIAQIRVKQNSKEGFMCYFYKVEVDPADKALIEDYINTVCEINTTERLLNDKIDFWISHLNERKILTYKQSEFVKSQTCYIKEKYDEDEDELNVEFCRGGTVEFVYTETPDKDWTKMTIYRFVDVYKSGIIDNSKPRYYRFDVYKPFKFEMELYSNKKINIINE